MDIQKSIGILLFIPFAGLVLVAGSAQATGITGNTYVNEEYEFQLSLPSNLEKWDMTDKKPDTGLVVINGPLFGIFSVSVLPLEELGEELVVGLIQPNFLDAWVDVTLALYPFLFDDWKEESKGKIKVGGVDAYEVVGTGAIEGIEMRLAIYMFVRGDFGFIFVGTSFSDPFPSPLEEFRSIVSTFKFLPPRAISLKGKTVRTWGQIKGQE